MVWNNKMNENKKLKEKYLESIDKKTRNLIIFFFPESNSISGGMFSILNLAKISRQLMKEKNYFVQTCYYPHSSCSDLLYKWYKNEEKIISFNEVIEYFKDVENLIIHIPEYISNNIFRGLDKKQFDYLKNIKNLQFNIMNQNIRLMLMPKELNYLKYFTTNITQTTAHHKYSTQEVCDIWGYPLYFIPAIMEVNYLKESYQNKENLICYSNDYEPLKEKILDKLSKKYNKFMFREINNITYDEYKKLISKAKYCISFGEGFDGYFSEPIMSGGLSFSVYNEDFFPSDLFRKFKNVYISYEQMLNKICEDIEYFENNSYEYIKLSETINKEIKKLYSWDEFTINVDKFYKKEYTFSPNRPCSLNNDKNVKPLISICIPTYNRAYHLQRVIKSIVKQRIFVETNYIEIIIADNCSTDFTEFVVKKFVDKFPKKIFYYKNNENIGGDKNYVRVLSFGNGEFLKLISDILKYNEDSLKEIINFIGEHRQKKPQLLFTNGRLDNKINTLICRDIDELVVNANQNISWICAFGIWKEDFLKLDNISRYAYLNFFQMDVILRLLSDGKPVIINNKIFCTDLVILNKSGYNVAKVFGINYFTILREYLIAGKLSKSVYQKEKKRMLYKYIIIRYFDFLNEHDFEQSGFHKNMKYFYLDYFYWSSYIYIGYLFLKNFSRKIKRKIINKNINRLVLWRAMNNDNMTYIGCDFDFSKVVVGEGAVGILNVDFGEQKDGILYIGDNVKIGNNVIFKYGNDENNNFIIVSDNAIIKPDTVITSGTIIC